MFERKARRKARKRTKARIAAPVIVHSLLVCFVLQMLRKKRIKVMKPTSASKRLPVVKAGDQMRAICRDKYENNTRGMVPITTAMINFSPFFKPRVAGTKFKQQIPKPAAVTKNTPTGIRFFSSTESPPNTLVIPHDR